MPTRANPQASIAASVPSLPSAGNLRLSVLTAVPAVLREFGHEPHTALAPFGLSPEAMAEPDTIVPFKNVDGLLRHCRDITGCEHFGLLVGQRVRLSYLGVLGFAMKSADNVASALDDLCRYRALHDQSALINLTRNSDLVSLQYLVTQPAVTAPDEVYDCAVATGCSLLRDLCGPDWKPSRVMLNRNKPANPAPYEKFYRCPIVFNHHCSGLEFQSRWLRVAPVGADPLLYRHMKREIREMSDMARDVAADLLSSLRLLLYNRHCNQGLAAALLGVNTRTLRRQLMSAGTTFRAELETSKFARARSLLHESELSSLEIADKLGYADLSTFSHAFKRWSGLSPAVWRRSARGRSLA